MNKKTDEIEFEAEFIHPIFGFKRTVRTFNGEQKSTFFQIPINFMLTHQENYFSVEITFIIGLKISLRILEN